MEKNNMKEINKRISKLEIEIEIERICNDINIKKIFEDISILIYIEYFISLEAYNITILNKFDGKKTIIEYLSKKDIKKIGRSIWFIK